MWPVLTFLIAVYSFIQVDAACEKDACYNVIAVGNRNSPALPQRKADCSSLGITVVDDDKTTTVTTQTTVTAFTATASITEIVTFTPEPQAKRRATASPSQTTAPGMQNTMFELEARDKIVGKGVKPSYAGACKDVQSYAVACLCFGIKAVVLPGVTKTLRQTISITTTVTESFKATALPTFALIAKNSGTESDDKNLVGAGPLVNGNAVGLEIGTASNFWSPKFTLEEGTNRLRIVLAQSTSLVRNSGNVLFATGAGFEGLPTVTCTSPVVLGQKITCQTPQKNDGVFLISEEGFPFGDSYIYLLDPSTPTNRKKVDFIAQPV